MSDPVILRARGHPNIKASHAKTFELTADPSITSAGTCIIGVEVEADEDALLALRGAVTVTLDCGGVEDRATARINPLYRRGDPLIFRRREVPEPRTFAIAASKGSSQLNRDLVAALAQPGAELIVTIEERRDQTTGDGVLFVVGMPIGNPSDISLRALDVLDSVDTVIAEDTRTARAFLAGHGIQADTVSFHDHNERDKTPWVIDRLQGGARIALVSEAGMPLVSDPGFPLVRAAVEAGLLVTPVPGPDAVTAALSVAGLPTDDFRFIGFPPRKSGDRKRFFAGLAEATYTTVFFEAPHRIVDTLGDLGSVIGDRRVVICRNLTKFGEDKRAGSCAELVERLTAEGTQRGELAIVVEGAAPAARTDATEMTGDLAPFVQHLADEGLPTKAIASALAKTTGMKRKDAFDLVLRAKGEKE